MRADPEMLPDLLEMVRSGSLHRDAVDFVVQVYGRGALAAVERELDGSVRREERERLEALRDRLR
ncbi:MAG: hypothetical protein AB7S26_38930 [Sandaracinaceae bacterium]